MDPAKKFPKKTADLLKSEAAVKTAGAPMDRPKGQARRVRLIRLFSRIRLCFSLTQPMIIIEAPSCLPQRGRSDEQRRIHLQLIVVPAESSAQSRCKTGKRPEQAVWL
jgi:hypothetical protein